MTKYLYDLHPDAVTIPQWFMQHGYTAMSIGKVLGGYGKEAADLISNGYPGLIMEPAAATA